MGKRNRNSYEQLGNLFFVTSTIVGFVEVFESEPLCDIMIENLRFYQDRGDFTIIAYVLMPNHFHLVLRVNGDKPVSECIANLKRMTSRQITAYLRQVSNKELLTALKKKAEKEAAVDSKVWKPRFDCFVLTNEDTLRQKIEYIHSNPVRKGLVDYTTAWKYSSASDYYGGSKGTLKVDTEWLCLGYQSPSGKGS
jgi:REP-associated tyrosine transposase